MLAAFEDEYGDSELKRKAGAEKIYQIHTMKGRSWWCLQNVPFFNFIKIKYLNYLIRLDWLSSKKCSLSCMWRPFGPWELTQLSWGTSYCSRTENRQFESHDLHKFCQNERCSEMRSSVPPGGQFTCLHSNPRYNFSRRTNESGCIQRI